MRPIDADALERIIAEKFNEHYAKSSYQFIHDFFRFVIRQIRKIPTVEARTEEDVISAYNEGVAYGAEQAVKHGRWERYLDFWRKCSLCGSSWHEQWVMGKALSYCPNCGAKMDLEE